MEDAMRRKMMESNNFSKKEARNNIRIYEKSYHGRMKRTRRNLEMANDAKEVIQQNGRKISSKYN
jgi:hypothetical protein